MTKISSKLEFSELFRLDKQTVSALPSLPALYMICKPDKSGNKQVIFAGVSSNIQTELDNYLNNKSDEPDLFFCFTPTSAKNILKNSKAPLYQRVA